MIIESSSAITSVLDRQETVRRRPGWLLFPRDRILLLEGKICRAWNDNLAALRSEPLSHDDSVEVDAEEFESNPFRERRLE